MTGHRRWTLLKEALRHFRNLRRRVRVRAELASGRPLPAPPWGDSQCVPTSLHCTRWDSLRLQRPGRPQSAAQAPAVRDGAGLQGAPEPAFPMSVWSRQGPRWNQRPGGRATVTGARFRSHCASLNTLVIFAQISINWELPVHK